jgi:hypothetical protein
VTAGATVTAYYSITYFCSQPSASYCTNAGGTVISGQTPYGAQLCEFSGSSCPSPQWAYVSYWTATSTAGESCTVSGECCDCGGGSTGCAPSGCYAYCTTGHSFQNSSATESCSASCNYPVAPYVSSTGWCTVGPARVVAVGCIYGCHSSVDCVNAGGTVYSDGAGGYFCEFSGSSCPAGWTQHDYWTATSPSGGSGNDGYRYSGGNTYCTQSGQCHNAFSGPSCCTTGSHTFADVAPETCNYWSNYQQCQYGGCYCNGCAETTVTASVTAIGCT